MATKEEIQQMKEEIKAMNYESLSIYINYLDTLYGTMYLVSKNRYSFHIYFIFEPASFGCHNESAGKEGIVSEMYYNLRTKKYWIKRNGVDVSFSERNVGAIFDRPNAPLRREERKVEYTSKEEHLESVFSFITAEDGSAKDLYYDAYKKLGSMGSEIRDMPGRFLKRLITDHSYIEVLHKANIDLQQVKIPKHIYNANGTAPHEVLGISKAQFKLYNKYKGDGLRLNLLINHVLYRQQKEGLEATNWSLDDINKKVIHVLERFEELDERYLTDQLHVFLNDGGFYEFYHSGHYTDVRHHNKQDTLYSIHFKHGLSLRRLVHYLYYECDARQGIEAHAAKRLFKDYHNMVSDMELDNYVRYPTSLKKAHDVTQRNYRLKLNDIQKQKFESMVETFERYEWSNRKYAIVAPKSPQDIIHEGNTLNHCVTGYVKNIINERTLIMFLRDAKERDKPLVTVEIRGNKVVQRAGQQNKMREVDEEEVDRFLDRYDNVVLSQMRKGEMNYEKARIN